MSGDRFIFKCFLSIRFALQYSKSVLWLGGSDLANENTFVWESSKKPFGYTNWYPGEPDDHQGKEDCVAMGVAVGARFDHWLDLDCDGWRLSSMCELLFDC